MILYPKELYFEPLGVTDVFMWKRNWTFSYIRPERMKSTGSKSNLYSGQIKRDAICHPAGKTMSKNMKQWIKKHITK